MKCSRLLWLALALLVIFTVGSVSAQGEITVTTNTYEAVFSERITFRLAAESKSDIEKISLFYVVKGERARIKGDPQFTSGKKVEAEYTWRMKQGDLPPSSEIEYYWVIEDAAGNELRTTPVSFLYQDERFQWQEISKERITLYWYSAGLPFAQRLLDSALSSLGQIEEDIGVELEEPIKIVVYKGKADMLKALPRGGEIFEREVTTLGTVASKNIILLEGTHPGVDSTIAHELTHVVVHLATDNPYAAIPAWLDEGLAMYSDKESSLQYAFVLAEAVREDKLISVRSLSSHAHKTEEITLYYAEVRSVVEFLLETYGKEKMAELLAIFKRGMLQEDALRQVYGFGLDELDALWRESLGARPQEAVPTTRPLEPEGRVEVTPTPIPSRERRRVCSALFLPGVTFLSLFFISRPRKA